MQLTELLDDVYSITGRPDLTDKTSLAVRAATLLAHNSDFYMRDIAETGISFDTAAYKQSLDIGVIPKYRKIKHLRKYDNSVVPGIAGDFLTILTTDELLDSYGIERCDIAYEAGAQINMSSSTLLEYMLLSYYKTPDITSLNYNSWIADEQQFLIVYGAASAIFAGVGNKEQANDYKILRNEQLAELKLSAVALVGE